MRPVQITGCSVNTGYVLSSIAFTCFWRFQMHYGFIFELYLSIKRSSLFLNGNLRFQSSDFPGVQVLFIFALDAYHEYIIGRSYLSP